MPHSREVLSARRRGRGLPRAEPNDNGHFRDGLFAKYLLDQGIPWPRTDTGLLKTDEDTFSDMSKVYPQLAPLRELHHALGQLRLKELAIGADGRNRTSIWPFAAKTGRNAPSSNGYIFGPSVWLRSLIKPQPEMGCRLYRLVSPRNRDCCRPVR
jgi:hypothetical protein